MSQQGPLEVSNIKTLTGDTGGAVGPDEAFNIDILGGDTTTITGNAENNSLTVDASISGYPITPYVVGPAGKAGYITIQDALDAANAAGGGIVGVQQGIYTEDLILYDATQVVGFGSNASIEEGSLIGQIIIVGTHTPPLSGSFTFKNVTFKSSGSVLFTEAVGSTIITVEKCVIGAISGYLFDLDNFGGELSLINSINPGSGNRGINNTSGSIGFIFQSELGSIGALNSNLGGTYKFQNSTCKSPISFLDGSNTVFNNGSFLDGFTTEGTCEVSVYESSIMNVSSSAIIHESDAPLIVSNCTVSSNTDPVIDGSGVGEARLTGIDFTSNSSLAATLTIVGGNHYSATYKSDYTDHGVILGQGATADMVATTAGTDGQLLIGATTADPAFASLTSTGDTITITPGANTLNIEAEAAVPTTFDTDLGSAVPAENNLDVLGGTNMNTSGSTNVVTINLDSDVLGLTDLTVDNLELNGNTLSSTDTNGDIVLAPDGTGTISVTAAPIVPSTDRTDSLGSATNSWGNVYADGLTFDDGSNIISAYKTGDWTPVLAFDGGSTDITYSTQSGSYTQVGRMINFAITLALTNKGSSTGNATISLPSLGTPLSNFNVAVTRYSNLTYPATRNSIFGIITGTTIQINASGDAVGTTSLTDTEFANDTYISFGGFYFV